MQGGARWTPGLVARVRVAGSTSNLGPGFDLLGLAVTLELEVELRAGREASGVTLELGPGCEEWPAGPENLLLRSWRAGVELSGAAEAPVVLRATSAIPVGRGLGSSGAAVAAGLLLGAAAGERDVPRERLLPAAIALEGHPDNVTPALLGGCVLAVPAEPEPAIARVELHPSLAFAVAWPGVPLATSFARSLLPKSVAFADAVENPRRLALLLGGLRSGDERAIRLGSEDRLHVPYRLPHIPGGASALDAARRAGAWMATISGSGSGLFAIGPRASIDAVARAMGAELERAAPPAVARVVEVASAAPRVELARR
jgi:homoserine kinase